MTVKSYSYVRKHFKEIINKVNVDCEPIIITTKKHNAVIMSEDSYNEIMETLYLQQNPANAKHLSESIENLEHGNVKLTN
ncbi:type II toxin-antitoxin system Phd/YefM family antitoxin [Mammaliicoccus sp. Dog046]|uniref:type II toxin-antitoxin system Phd/YefM family antitoxin n=1 Tax=Mammaliicoccus sp. Dog046 TaxID=3034233 RepID=UPI002B2568E6|nr:type II toxin-antitoxin system Phd/YefM family antitoxin [Mammaliicoccus sp. Dog046]WQK85261.1 type II toxin-antitoxin system Phd/YefM family antitoxin [Mammaliicoccus sp. Dog046]